MMGAYCQITLPHTARIGDVIKVLGVLAGLPAKLEPLGDDAVTLRVEGIKAEGQSSMPECPEITWTDVSGEVRWCLFHYKFEHGGRGLFVRSTPFWCAVAVKLVDLFGGAVDFNDCDDSITDYSAPGTPLQAATNNPEWDKWQHAMLNVGPLTQADINKWREVAAYPEQKWRGW